MEYVVAVYDVVYVMHVILLELTPHMQIFLRKLSDICIFYISSLDIYINHVIKKTFWLSMMNVKFGAILRRLICSSTTV